MPPKSSRKPETLAGLESEEETRPSSPHVEEVMPVNPQDGQSSRANIETGKNPVIQTYERKKTTVVNDANQNGQAMSNNLLLEVLASMKELVAQQKATHRVLEESMSNGQGIKTDQISHRKDKSVEVGSSGKRPVEEDIPESWYVPAHEFKPPYESPEELGFEQNNVLPPRDNFIPPRTRTRRVRHVQNPPIPEMRRPHGNPLFDHGPTHEDWRQPGLNQGYDEYGYDGFDYNPDPPPMHPNIGPRHGDFYQPPLPPVGLPGNHGRGPLHNNPVLRNEVLGLMQEWYGPAARGVQPPMYRTPYPDWVDRQTEIPKEYKIPTFQLFSGEGKQSTIEHVARFTAQLKELGSNPRVKLKLFPTTLTGVAFEWYSNLPPNSVQDWAKMEALFHSQFYQPISEVTVADLARVKQKPDEKVDQFVRRFNKARAMCKVQIPDIEYVRIAQDGLTPELRKKFGTDDFKSLVDMVYKVSKYESILDEDFTRANSSLGTYYRDQSYDIEAAEIVEHEPVFCDNLVRKESTHAQKFKNKEINKVYSFDISKADEIFDHLLKKKFIKLPSDVKLPSAEERRGKTYCKWHDAWSHSTKNCNVFRDRIQDQVKKGKLKFPEKPMGMDTDPFPKIGEATTNTCCPTSLIKSIEDMWKDREFEVQMNSVHMPRGGFSRSGMASRANHGQNFPRRPRSRTSPEKGPHFPTLEASFLEALCINCRINYMKFRDFDKQGKKWFPHTDKGGTVFSKGEESGSASGSGKDKQPWGSSKRNASASPVPVVSKKEFHPMKKPNVGEHEMVQEENEEDKPERYGLVKGVPEWFIKRIKPELFQEYRSLKTGHKTYKPSNAPVGQWVVVRDPKTRMPKMQPVLSKSQIRKIQRKYTLYRAGAFKEGRPLAKFNWPNPRFNRRNREDDETTHWKHEEQCAHKVLSKVAKALDADDGDESLVSPRSLASYQDDLLEVMMADQKKEEDGSPMDVSNAGNSEQGDADDERSRETPEESFERKMVQTIQFGSLPEVQINVISPVKFNFGPFAPGLRSQARRCLAPELGSVPMVEASDSEETETDSFEERSHETMTFGGKKYYDTEEVVAYIMGEEPEVTSKENAAFVDIDTGSECPLIVDLDYVDVSYPFKLPTGDMRHHLKPLYITATFNGIPLSRVLVDNGAAVNIMPFRTLKKLGKERARLIPTSTTIAGFAGESKNAKGIISIRLVIGSVMSDTAFFVIDNLTCKYNALLGRDWIHANGCIPSSMHQSLMIVKYQKGKETGVEEVKADPHPFSTSANCAEAEMYSPYIYPLSEIPLTAAIPAEEPEVGEVAELKKELKEAVDDESDTQSDDSAWM